MNIQAKWPAAETEVAYKVALQVALKIAGADLAQISGRLFASGRFDEAPHLVSCRRASIIRDAREAIASATKALDDFERFQNEPPVSDDCQFTAHAGPADSSSVREEPDVFEGSRGAGAVEPVSYDDVLDAVRLAVAQQIARDPCAINSGDDLRADLGLDMTDLSNVAIAIEHRFNVTLPGEIEDSPTVEAFARATYDAINDVGGVG